MQFKLTWDNYYKQRGILRMGFLVEAVYSTQTLFNNYTATALELPAFQPIAECKTLFQPNYRCNIYGAAGLKNIITIKNRIDLRVEGYIYQPYQEIKVGVNNHPTYVPPLLNRYLLGTATLVGHTPIGPISFSVNYYYKETHPFTFLFHFGYIIFNEKSTD